MRKIVLASIAVSTVLAMPAAAQDRGPFTGPRIEALAGYDNLSASDGGEGSDGLVYGGAVGYDIQAGGVVLGAEGEITGSTVRERARNLIVAGDRLRVGAGRDLYVGGRLGYVISPLAMVYAKAGYTNARVEARYRDGTTRFTDGTNLDGFRLGAGLEYNLSPSTYVKGEYRYSNYSRAERFDIDADRHQLVAGVGIRF